MNILKPGDIMEGGTYFEQWSKDMHIFLGGDTSIIESDVEFIDMVTDRVYTMRSSIMWYTEKSQPMVICTVPNVLLTEPHNFRVNWIDNGQRRTNTYEVRRRSKPADYQYQENDYPGANPSTSKNVIPQYSFYGRTDLTKLPHMGSDDVIIGDYAFGNCTGLSDFELESNNIVKVGEAAFMGCTGLTSVDLPHCAEIGTGAFSYCPNLTSITIPAVTVLESGVVEGCSAEATLIAPAVKRIRAGSITTIIPNMTSLNFPVVERIEDGTFGPSPNTDTLSLPKLKVLGCGNFSGWTTLKTVDLPEMECIGSRSLCGATNLQSINIPNIKFIGSGALSNLPATITKLELPKIEKIDVGGLSANNLTALILSNPDKVCEGWFINFELDDYYIYVPKRLLESYKTDSVWSTMIDHIRVIEDYPEICG